MIPTNEDARVHSVCNLGIMNTPADPRFDDITKLLCSIFKMPIALVTLLDRDRQWFKSVQGLGEQGGGSERRVAFCAWTFLPLHPEVLIVPDARLDGRFSDNPFVTKEPFLRFYAGAPLVDSKGFRLGSLCVADYKTRDFDAENANVLCNFAEVVVREIEKEKRREEESQRIKSEQTKLLRAMDCFSEGVMLISTLTSTWDILFINDAWTRITGINKESAAGKSMWLLFDPMTDLGETKEEALRQHRGAVEDNLTFSADLVCKAVYSSGERVLTANFRPAGTETLDNHMPAITIPGKAGWGESSEADSLYFITIQAASMRLMRRMSRANSASSSLPARHDIRIADHSKPFEDLQMGPLLGQGSFGKVYRAIWNGAPVAVKIIQHSEEVEDAEGGDPLSLRGTLEAIHSVDLAHPNVVQTYKSTQRPIAGPETSQRVTAEGRPMANKTLTETCLVLEFCDKGNLQDSVDRGSFNRLQGQGSNSYFADMEAVRNTAREIVAAMTYLHSLDILHGDLTGGNILLVSSNKDKRGFIAKVADFGLSRVLSAEAVSTGTYGTVTHMPPELLTTGKLSKATDVYAFGVTLWEMLTGQRPWAGLLQMQVIFHVTINHKALEFPANTPSQWKELALKCMHRDALERPRFLDILSELDRLEL